MPVRFRESGGASWLEGTTENVSESGILFRAERPLPLRTAIEGSVALPVTANGEPPGELLFRGVVVRTAFITAADSFSVVAASMQSYRFVRGRRTLRVNEATDIR